MGVADEKDSGLLSDARIDGNPGKSPADGALAQSRKRFAFFVCHHKPGPLLKDEIFIPIHVGAANSNQVLPDCIRDDVGDNISSRNANYSELTAIYWAWKNVEADYYGFFHYRRLMNFSVGKKNSLTIYDFSQRTVRKVGWDRKTIEAVCAQYDVITLPRWNVHPVGLPKEQMTSYEFYAREHFAGDLDTVLSVIKKRSPDVYPFVLRHVHESRCSYANISIMKRDLFKQYAAWLFDIIFESEKIIDITGYDSYQRRIWGFIAERLCGGYIDFLVATQGARSGELGLVSGVFSAPVKDAPLVMRSIEAQRISAKEMLMPERVHVAFCIDENYASHCGVAIASMLSNIHPAQHITIHILHDRSLSSKSKSLISSLSTQEFVSFNFIEVNRSDFMHFPSNRSHVSTATYYRLALHHCLPECLEKVIYLDADIVVEDNITKIWVDLGDCFAAACADEGGVLQSRRLRLPVSQIYVNAGVMVFNLQKLRETDADNLYLESFLQKKRDIILQDQDILNIAFANKILALPLRWNANARLYSWNDLDYQYSESDATAAALNPAIVHFTDVSKPWIDSCAHPLKSLYWHWRRQTPWRNEKVRQPKYKSRAADRTRAPLGKQLERLLRPHFKQALRWITSKK